MRSGKLLLPGDSFDFFCGAECEKFKDDEHMKRCAEECKKCAKACREMLKYKDKIANTE